LASNDICLEGATSLPYPSTLITLFPFEGLWIFFLACCGVSAVEAKLGVLSFLTLMQHARQSSYHFSFEKKLTRKMFNNKVSRNCSPTPAIVSQ